MRNYLPKSNLSVLRSPRFLLLILLVFPSTVSAQLELHEAFTPFLGFPGEIEGRDLFRHTITGPAFLDAVCNDGSPAVMYVRASDPKGPHVNDWVIVPEAGSACLGTTPDGIYKSCQDRWEANGSVVFNAWKMSTDPDGDAKINVSAAIEGEGIFQQGVPGALPPSFFADWNQVYVNYCSSDFWAGSSDILTFSHSQGGPDYYIRFRGHTIMAAAISKLRAGGVQPDQYDVKADAHFTMPSLDDAKEVVVAGTSAGGDGVINNADWLASQLGRPIIIIASADFKPRTQYLDPESFISDNFKGHWNFTFPLINAITDDSCVADLQGTGMQWKCAQPGELLIDHLDDDLPIFVRQDLTDSLISTPYEEKGASLKQFSEAVLQSLQDLADANKENAYWAPRCGRHEALTSDEYYFTNLLTTLRGHRHKPQSNSGSNNGPDLPPGFIDRSYHEAISAWLRGETVRDSEVPEDDPRFPLTTCPE